MNEKQIEALVDATEDLLAELAKTPETWSEAAANLHYVLAAVQGEKA